jgi:hypothetical protein
MSIESSEDGRHRVGTFLEGDTEPGRIAVSIELSGRISGSGLVRLAAGPWSGTGSSEG